MVRLVIYYQSCPLLPSYSSFINSLDINNNITNLQPFLNLFQISRVIQHIHRRLIPCLYIVKLKILDLIFNKRLINTFNIIWMFLIYCLIYSKCFLKMSKSTITRSYHKFPFNFSRLNLRCSFKEH